MHLLLRKQLSGAQSPRDALHDSLTHGNNLEELESPGFKLPQGAGSQFPASGERIPEGHMHHLLKHRRGNDKTRARKSGSYGFDSVNRRLVPVSEIQREVAIGGD